MTEEFDYDLTPSQWETLKALRTPASKLPRMSRYTIDSLIALELATMNGNAPDIAVVAGSGGLIRATPRGNAALTPASRHPSPAR
jgi:hypothetical protein